MNKNIKKNILIEASKSYDKIYQSKKSSKQKVDFKGFIDNYFKEKEINNLSKYVIMNNH